MQVTGHIVGKNILCGVREEKASSVHSIEFIFSIYTLK